MGRTVMLQNEKLDDVLNAMGGSYANTPDDEILKFISDAVIRHKLDRANSVYRLEATYDRSSKTEMYIVPTEDGGIALWLKHNDDNPVLMPITHNQNRAFIAVLKDIADREDARRKA